MAVKGQWGVDVNGQPMSNTSSATNTWALMLGALQGILAALTGGGGGASGNVVITGTTATGNTVSTTTNLTTGGATTIAAGALSIEFLLSSDFQGTINGAAVNNTGTIVLGVYRLDAPPWKPLSALTYTITAGSAILTVQV